MASELQTSIDMGEPKVTMMDGFEKPCMHGSIQSAGTDDVSSAQQMKFFKVAVNNMRHTQMVLRVHVPEQNVDFASRLVAPTPPARTEKGDTSAHRAEYNGTMSSPLLPPPALTAWSRTATSASVPNRHIAATSPPNGKGGWVPGGILRDLPPPHSTRVLRNSLICHCQT